MGCDCGSARQTFRYAKTLNMLPKAQSSMMMAFPLRTHFRLHRLNRLRVRLCVQIRSALHLSLYHAHTRRAPENLARLFVHGALIHVPLPDHFKINNIRGWFPSLTLHHFRL